MDTVLSLILLGSKMLKVPRVKLGAHILKKLTFVTNKCLAHDAFGKCAKKTEKLSKYTVVYLNTYMHKFSYYLVNSKKKYPSYWPILITEMHCNIQAVPKLTQNDLSDAFINAKKINVTFCQPVN